MSWISDFESEMPEVNALKLIIFVHNIINKSKFPMEHRRCRVVLIKIFKKLDQLTNLVLNYLFSIRELPDKYHIHRIFPEILREKVFKQIFSRGFSDLKLHSDPYSSYGSKNIGNVRSVLDLVGILLDEEGVIILGNLTKQNMLNNNDLDFARRLVSWNVSPQSNWLKLNYKLIQDPSAWKIHWSLAQINTDQRSLCPGDETYLKNFLITNYPNLLATVDNDFTGIGFSFSSTTLESIRTTMIKSLMDNFETEYQSDIFKDQFLVNDNILSKIYVVRSELIEFINDKGNNEVISDSVYINHDNSKILNKLNRSISEYIFEKGAKEVFKIKLLDEQKSMLNDLNFMLGHYIEDLEHLQRDSAKHLGLWRYKRLRFPII